MLWSSAPQSAGPLQEVQHSKATLPLDHDCVTDQAMFGQTGTDSGTHHYVAC